jgi:hypothetical protein
MKTFWPCLGGAWEMPGDAGRCMEMLLRYLEMVGAARELPLP